MTKTPVTVSVARYLILADVLVWLVFAAVVASGRHPAIPPGPLIRWGYAGLGLVTCLALFGGYAWLSRGGGLVYYPMVSLLGLISVGTLLDQVGVVDLLVLAVNLAALLLLIKDRDFYLQRKSPGAA